VIAGHPDVLLLYNNLAGIKEALGHPESSVKALLEQALTIDPSVCQIRAGAHRRPARRCGTGKDRIKRNNRGRTTIFVWSSCSVDI
jgi:hypothetical protein